MSHPMWVRGLKHAIFKSSFAFALSHPMWVRGLKHLLKTDNHHQQDVAPHVGAWIETLSNCKSKSMYFCRTPCGCVD